jgi:hypothetical protein
VPVLACRGRTLLTTGRPPAARRATIRPGARERENQQHDEPERDAGRAHLEAQTGHTAARVLGHAPHDRAQDDQNGAGHDRHGSRNRQGDD